ncbi:MAG TPA: DUF2182 domain-containing protein [Allosphingosinicella sp.]
MTGAKLEALLRRDRAVVLTALGVIGLLAWIHLIGMAPAAPGVAMGGMETGPAQWSAADFATMLAMWAAMMVGMMTPSVAPMLLLYARVARSAEERGQPFAATGWFALGYLLAWSAFAMLATGAQWLMEQAALMTPAMAIADRQIGGALLVAAGVYQWTPAKNACLGRCRSPLQFIQSQGGFRRERRASLMLGLKHGFYCLGCCWALMLLLFLGGVMNLLWIAALAAIVLAEKVLPGGQKLARAVGAALAVAGGAMLVGAI